MNRKHKEGTNKLAEKRILENGQVAITSFTLPVQVLLNVHTVLDINIVSLFT